MNSQFPIPFSPIPRNQMDKKSAKGHRQKGAGTVVHDKPAVVTNDGVVLKCIFFCIVLIIHISL